MTLQEGNKLIAEFMEWSEFPGNMLKEKLGVAPKRIEDLKFHSSWDWLMPVVEKIESIELPRICFYEVLIANEYCAIKVKSEQDFFFVSTEARESRNKIDAVWQTVIKFIQTTQK